MLERHDSIEGQEVGDTRVGTARVNWIRVDAQQPGDGHVSTTPAATPGFSIDDPVPDRLLGYREVSVREMVALNDFVVVARFGPGIEDRLHSCQGP